MSPSISFLTSSSVSISNTITDPTIFFAASALAIDSGVSSAEPYSAVCVSESVKG